MGKLVNTARSCGTRKKNGEPCKMQAGFGTNHLGWGKCKFHGGTTPALTTAAAKEELASRMVAFGTPIDIEPGDALLVEVRRSAGIVRWLEQVISEFTQIPIDNEFQKNARDIVQSLGEQGREVAVWVVMYRDERKMLREACQIALKNNIAERQVQLAEEQGRLTAHVIQAVLGDPELGLTAEQKTKSRQVAQRHLMLVSGVPA